LDSYNQLHKWHPKTCDPTLSQKQLSHCKRSAMNYEGDKAKLGEVVVDLLDKLGMSIDTL
jgi:hypothetical protein